MSTMEELKAENTRLEEQVAELKRENAFLRIETDDLEVEVEELAMKNKELSNDAQKLKKHLNSYVEKFTDCRSCDVCGFSVPMNTTDCHSCGNILPSM